MELETFLAIIVIGFGTARLTALLVYDDLTEKLRDLIFHYSPPEDNDDAGYFYQMLQKATHEEQNSLHHIATDLPWWHYRFTGAVEPRPAGFWGKAISCKLCISVWIAGLNGLAYLLVPTVALGLNAWMMISLLGVTQMGRWWR